MARDFKALVRLNDLEVDQHRRVLGELLAQLDNLEGRLVALEAEIVAEQALAAQSPTEGGLTYGNYAAAAINRREDLKRRITEKEGEVAVARDNLREAYLELKKYEIAEEQRETKVAAELDKLERQELDEIGLTAHTRKS